MGVFKALPPDFESWTFPGGAAAARRDVAVPVREALAAAGSLHRWAGQQPERDVFTGRAETYGVAMAGLRTVVRHAMRGGAIAPLLGDRYFGPPRFLREITMARRLTEDGVPTPAVLAGVRYDAAIGHRADVVTERVDGRDLATIFFGDAPPAGAERTAILQAVGVLFGTLYRVGFVHPDLQLRNILVGPLTALPPYRLNAWLLDVDTVFRMSGAPARLRNLRRFYRSWDKWNELKSPRLTAADRQTFSESFARASRL